MHPGACCAAQHRSAGVGFDSSRGRPRAAPAQIANGFDSSRGRGRAAPAQIANGFDSSRGRARAAAAQIANGFDSSRRRARAAAAQIANGFDSRRCCRAKLARTDCQWLRSGILPRWARQENRPGGLPRNGDLGGRSAPMGATVHRPSSARPRGSSRDSSTGWLGRSLRRPGLCHRENRGILPQLPGRLKATTRHKARVEVSRRVGQRSATHHPQGSYGGLRCADPPYGLHKRRKVLHT